jgi:hypothetical protein
MMSTVSIQTYVGTSKLSSVHIMQPNVGTLYKLSLVNVNVTTNRIMDLLLRAKTTT